jgi:hypothetical protein
MNVSVEAVVSLPARTNMKISQLTDAKNRTYHNVQTGTLAQQNQRRSVVTAKTDTHVSSFKTFGSITAHSSSARDAELPFAHLE